MSLCLFVSSFFLLLFVLLSVLLSSPFSFWYKYSFFHCCVVVLALVHIDLDRLLVERRTRDQKVASSNPGRSGERVFFSRVNFVCWLLFGVRSTSVWQPWHVKYPGHSTKSAGGRLHLNTHTPFTQQCRSGLTMPLSRRSVGTYPETNSHATRQETLGYCRLSSLSYCGLILA